MKTKKPIVTEECPVSSWSQFNRCNPLIPARLWIPLNISIFGTFFYVKNKNENKNTPLNLRIYFVVILIVNSGPTGSYSNCAFLVYTARITFPNSGMSHPIFQKITLRQYFKVGDYRHQSAGTLGNCCH